MAGATNRSYNLGSGTQGHQAIKENQAVFNDFLPLLNSVPPRPAVLVTLDPDAGEYPSPLAITVLVEPPETTVSVTSSRLLKSYQAGYLVDEVGESRTETVGNGQAISLANAGRWEVVATAAGSAPDQARTYWVGVQSSVASIVTDNTEPFDGTLLVTGRASDLTATLYYSLDYPTANSTWNVGAAVTITEDSTVSFIAINPQGVASEIVSRTFTKRVPWDDAVTANAIDHYLAGRIDVNEYLAYSDQFGFFTAFTLYLINGDWVLNPNVTVPPVGTSPSARLAGGPLLIRVASDSPQPGQHALHPDHQFAIVIEGVVLTDDAPPFSVHYTRDGSIPTTASPSFDGDAGVASARFEFAEPGNHVIACFATDGRGNTDYRAFAYTLILQ